MSEKCLQVNLVEDERTTGNWCKLWVGGGVQFCCNAGALQPLASHIKWACRMLMVQPGTYGLLNSMPASPLVTSSGSEVTREMPETPTSDRGSESSKNEERVAILNVVPRAI